MKIWRPFTQEQNALESIKITRGEGSYLFDQNNKRYADMISSWWVNILGHSNEEIATAIALQAHKLEHVIFTGFSHEPAENLCTELSKLLPKELDKFFFSDNGSTAVEVALKMSYQFFKNQNICGKNVFINLEGGYHGDTIGAMSAAGKGSSYHSTFKEFFFETFSIQFPNNINEEDQSISKLKLFLKNNHQKICAFIVEPLVQGAAGMRIYRPEFLNKIVNIIKNFEILVIFDEVMSGFYRTGTMFAMNQTDVLPDFICLSKGLTGGFLPLSLTITTQKIYNAFLSTDFEKTFVHGHSYTANPISCAAALKSLEILQRVDTLNNIKNINVIHQNSLSKIKNVSNKRILGTIAAFDVKNKTSAKILQNNLLESGIIIRPINKTIYILPPYCTSCKDLQEIYTIIANKILTLKD